MEGTLVSKVVGVIEPPLARALGRLVESPGYLKTVSRTLGATYKAKASVTTARDAVVRFIGLPSRADHVRLHSDIVRLESRAADLQDRLGRLEARLSPEDAPHTTR